MQWSKVSVGVCRDEDGLDRTLVHRMVAEWAVEFFNKNMKD